MLLLTLIVQLFITSIASANQGDRISSSQKRVEDDTNPVIEESNQEYLTPEWISKEYGVPIIRIVQELNKGYTLKELKMAYDMKGTNPQTVGELLHQISPKVREKINEMNLSKEWFEEHSQEKNLREKVGLGKFKKEIDLGNPDLPSEEHVEISNGSWSSIEDPFDKDDILNSVENVTNNVYKSVYGDLYGNNTKMKMMANSSDSIKPSFPTSFDELALKRLNIRTNAAPYSVGGNENVSLVSGSLDVSNVDMVLPGRNGLSFSLVRKYNSTDAIYYDKDYFQDFVNKVSYYPGLSARLYYKYTNESVSPYGGASDFEFYPFWSYESFLQYMGSYTKWKFPTEYPVIEEFNDVNRKILEKAWPYVNPDSANSPIFIANEDVTLNGTPLIAKAYTTGKVLEFPDSRSLICLEYNYYGCQKYKMAFGNKIKDRGTQENRFPIGKGWSWDIPYMEYKGNKNYITLFGGATYELDGLMLKGYPWKDISLNYDSSIKVNDITSSYVLKNINGQRQYFSSSGRLLQISDLNDNKIQFEYSNVEPYGYVLTKIRDVLDNEINISYSGMEVVLTQGDRTVKYTKTKDPQGNKELLSIVRDAMDRETIYDYMFAAAPFDLVGGGRPLDNYVALLEHVYHPTKARTDYGYSSFNRTLGYNANETVYRMTSREDVVTQTDGLEKRYNHFDYIYNGDGGSVSQYSTSFSTIINNGRLKSTYIYDKVYVDDNSPEIFYNTDIIRDDGTTKNIEKMVYDRENNRPTPIKVTTVTTKGTAQSVEKSVSRSFDEYGNVIIETDPNQVFTFYIYDPTTHLLSSVHKPISSYQVLFTKIERFPVTNNIKSIENRENNESGPLKAMISYEYDPYGNPEKITIKDDARDIISKFSYSSIYNSGFRTGQTIQVTDADNLSSTVSHSFEYKKHTGEITAYTDGEGYVTRYEYDKLGRLTSLTNPDNSLHRLIYNDATNEVTEVDPTGVRVKTKWNPLGFKTQSGLEGKNPLEYEYDAFGRLIWSEDGANIKTEYTYDNWDRVIRTALPGPEIPTTMIEYDDINQTITTNDPENNKDVQTFDVLGRNTETKSYGNNGELIGYLKKSYDFAGNVRELKDGLDEDLSGEHITNYEYDILGRLTSVRDPEQYITRYSYSLAGQLKQIDYPDGSKFEKFYDQMGRVIKKIDPMGQISTNYYDANSNLSKHIDRKGTVYNYSYNNLNFLMSKRINNVEVVSFDYDSAGRRQWMEDQTGRTLYKYFPTTKWLQSVVYPDQNAIQYEYDEQGNRSVMIDPFGVTTTYQYDSRNRLEKVGPSGTTPDVVYQYKKNNQPFTALHVNGALSTFNYSGLQTTLRQNLTNGRNINTYEYVYDLHGNQKSKTENNNMYTFTYDKLNRIETSSQFNEDYSYDRRGNRLTQVSEKEINIQNVGYQYDLDNRLLQVNLETGSQVNYKYNGDGLLVERSEKDNTTRYYYDGTKIIAEADVSNGKANYKASYIRGNELVARVDRNGNRAYYVHNGHGDVVGLLDIQGNTLNTYSYDIWGNPLEVKETIEQPFRYSGELWDNTATLQYLRARWYDPGIGRFINEDTYEGDITNPLSLNLYTYVHNNPLKYVDPTGNAPMPGSLAGQFINLAKSEGTGSQFYWDMKQELGIGRQWGDVRLDRNQFLYLFNLATMSVCSSHGSCHNATEADAANGYTNENAEWARQELMYHYDKEYVESEERLQTLAMGIVGEAGAARNAVKGWIKRETYQEIRSTLSKEAQKKFSDSMKKGIVGAEGANGIKKLKGNGIDGYMYEVKIKGSYGGWRLLGNMDEKTGHIVFEVLKNTH